MAETEDGLGTYIKSYRSILDHELLDTDNSAFIVFMKLLHKVDRKTGKWVTGRFKLMELTNLKASTAWDALKRLEAHKMVKVESNSQFSTISICNWSKYQSKADSKPTANRQQTDTLQEIRNKNIYSNPQNQKGVLPQNELKDIPEAKGSYSPIKEKIKEYVNQGMSVGEASKLVTRNS